MKKTIGETIKIIYFFLFFLGLMGAGICDGKKTIPQFKDFLSLKVLYDPVISPDGRYILYSVRQTLWEKNEFQSQLWLADVLLGKSHQLTYADESCTDARWSPDSKLISFLSVRNGEPQIRLMPVNGGESRPLISSKTGFSEYEWSPDGKCIAYVAPDTRGKEERETEEKYGNFEIIDEGFNVNHLWLQNVETGEASKLVNKDDLNINEISWSPDGRMIAFSATPNTDINSSSKSDIYIVDINNHDIRILVAQIGEDCHPFWSPDSKTIAFNSSPGTEAYFATVDIFTIPQSGGIPICHTKNFDEDVNMIAWNRNGIFFTAYQGMTAHLFLLNLDKKQIIQITKGKDFELDGISLSSDGKEMAFIYQNSQKIKELYFSKVNQFKPKRLTDFSGQIKDWRLSKKETIKWKSTDGTEITGVLSKPANFDAQKKYPLFVFIHGGPEATSIPYKLDPWNRYYPLLQLVARGAIILQPNYRGSAGFGEHFRKLNYRNLGIGCYQDIISGVDFLISLGFVDNGRVAAMGWSQGGYLSAFVACFSDRFKAVSAGGVTGDWETYYSTTDLPDSIYHYLGARPWDDAEIYKVNSPISYINNAKTPILLQNGEFDRRVPIANAFQLYRALKSKGIPTKLIIYKDCGHGIPRPKENLAVLTHNWQWFNKYIWNEE